MRLQDIAVDEEENDDVVDMFNQLIDHPFDSELHGSHGAQPDDDEVAEFDQRISDKLQLEMTQFDDEVDEVEEFNRLLDEKERQEVTCCPLLNRKGTLECRSDDRAEHSGRQQQQQQDDQAQERPLHQKETEDVASTASSPQSKLRATPKRAIVQASLILLFLP